MQVQDNDLDIRMERLFNRTPPTPPEMTADSPRSAVALGRSVIVASGAAAPYGWDDAPRIVIDAAALAEPDPVVSALRDAWTTRTPVVIEMGVDPARFRRPETSDLPLWSLGPGWTPTADDLHFLVWSNSYDARAGGEPIWWWAQKAARLGATVGGPADILLPDGVPAWIDGGPRAPLGEAGPRRATTSGREGYAAVLDGALLIHRESVEFGDLLSQPAPVDLIADLAPDQRAAVGHSSGPARVIAPAGSGKTRVLTERYRHLLTDRGYERSGLLAVAYNRKAQEEMSSRLRGLHSRIRTLNSWGYAILEKSLGFRPRLLDESEVRDIIRGLVPIRQQRVNTDPLAPYLDGLSLIRLGLRHPEEVEDEVDDVPGLAGAFEPYREELRRRDAIDFDEQIYGAVEALVRDGDFRRRVQELHRHLLVDEFQDLTPAHVLLVRLAAGPQADVFGVGDDDQVIYGHAGADPRFLIDFREYFPGAGEHALEVNYRCAAPITEAARTLLSYNDVRVSKEIRPGPAADPDPAALMIDLHDVDTGAESTVDTVRRWLREADATPSSIAVLTRTNSLLLAPHVALAEADVPIDSGVGDEVLGRLGVRAALAYLRIAISSGGLAGDDLIEVYRRPSRGMPRWITKWLKNCRSIGDIRRAAARIDDPKVSAKLEDLAADLERLSRLAAKGASTRELLQAVRDEVGLGSAMTLLDSTGGAAGSHLDDLEGLLQVADLHPDATTFEDWLFRVLRREHTAGGVTLATIHKVKGREWDRVIVFGATEGLMPHRLANDREEERRVFHVGITRGRLSVRVLADRERPSRFLAELDGSAPREVPSSRSRSSRGPATATATARVPSDARSSTATTTGARRDPADRETRASDPGVDAAAAALRSWRLTRARSDRVPAYVVLSDRHLEGIAERGPTTPAELRACPGIGPARLDRYGDEILEVLASLDTK